MTVEVPMHESTILRFPILITACMIDQFTRQYKLPHSMHTVHYALSHMQCVLHRHTPTHAFTNTHTHTHPRALTYRNMHTMVSVLASLSLFIMVHLWIQ